MKRLFIYIFVLLFFSNSYAKDVSEFFNNLIPGEGLTEASIQINEDDNPDIEILALRDIESTNNSNLFTQFSLQTQDVGQDDLRYIGNGIGSFNSISISGYTKFFAFNFEPYSLINNYKDGKIYERSAPFRNLNDTKSAKNINGVGLRKADIYLHYNGLGIGISNNNNTSMTNYVLGKWTDSEQKNIKNIIQISTEVTFSFIQTGIERTMNFYNKKNFIDENL